nr:hypothetical protein CFP56_01430 [Quercus suber]POE48108.1 hypothetical protein CFP56_01436 [Quercus suber]
MRDSTPSTLASVRTRSTNPIVYAFALIPLTRILPCIIQSLLLLPALTAASSSTRLSEQRPPLPSFHRNRLRRDRISCPGCAHIAAITDIGNSTRGDMGC